MLIIFDTEMSDFDDIFHVELSLSFSFSPNYCFRFFFLSKSGKCVYGIICVALDIKSFSTEIVFSL